MAKTNTLIGLLLFFMVWSTILNTADFLDGSNFLEIKNDELCVDDTRTFIQKTIDFVINADKNVAYCEQDGIVKKLRKLSGLGSYGDIPWAFTFFISLAWLLIIAYFTYEAIAPTK